MKKIHVITLAISLIFSTALNATAFGPPGGRGLFGTDPLHHLQTALNLTGEQSTAVKKLFAKSRKTIQAVIKNNHLQRKDIKVLRTLAGKFRENGQKQLATVLSMEEIQTMREKVFAGDALAFMSLSSTEKQAELQNTLGIDREKAVKVAAIIEQQKSQNEQVLEGLAFNPEQLVTFQRELIAERETIKNALREILSDEQIKLFEKEHRGPFRGDIIQ